MTPNLAPLVAQAGRAPLPMEPLTLVPSGCSTPTNRSTDRIKIRASNIKALLSGLDLKLFEAISDVRLRAQQPASLKRKTDCILKVSWMIRMTPSAILNWT